MFLSLQEIQQEQINSSFHFEDTEFDNLRIVSMDFDLSFFMHYQHLSKTSGKALKWTASAKSVVSA